MGDGCDRKDMPFSPLAGMHGGWGDTMCYVRRDEKIPYT